MMNYVVLLGFMEKVLGRDLRHVGHLRRRSGVDGTGYSDDGHII